MHNEEIMFTLKAFITYLDSLKGQTDEKLFLINFDKINIYTLQSGLLATSLEFSKFVILKYNHSFISIFSELLITLASCYLHISLTGQKMFAEF